MDNSENNLHWQHISGQSDSHVLPLSGNSTEKNNTVKMHPRTAHAFALLRQDATAEGINLTIVSGFRSFERQCAIWNAKARGQLAVVNDCDEEINMATLDEKQQAFAILRFSALPGTSRHHWGTDIDVYDRNAVSSEFVPALTHTESQRHFRHMHHWLDKQITQRKAHGFFRPYQHDDGGVAIEPWHLSWHPLAHYCEQHYDINALSTLIENTADFALKHTVLNNISEIAERFIVGHPLRTTAG